MKIETEDSGPNAGVIQPTGDVADYVPSRLPKVGFVRMV